MKTPFYVYITNKNGVSGNYYMGFYLNRNEFFVISKKSWSGIEKILDHSYDSKEYTRIFFNGNNLLNVMYRK